MSFPRTTQRAEQSDILFRTSTDRGNARFAFKCVHDRVRRCLRERLVAHRTSMSRAAAFYRFIACTRNYKIDDCVFPSRRDIAASRIVSVICILSPRGKDHWITIEIIDFSFVWDRKLRDITTGHIILGNDRLKSICTKMYVSCYTSVDMIYVNFNKLQNLGNFG